MNLSPINAAVFITIANIVMVVLGMVLQNRLVIQAFAAAANVVMVGGFVNRITA